MRVGWAEEGFMVDLDQSIYEDDEELCPEVDCDEINAELADLKKQLTEARALLREANCADGRCIEEQVSSSLYGHKPWHVCDWCQRRRALLKED